MNDRRTDEQTARPKVSRLAIGAAAVAAIVSLLAMLPGPGVLFLAAPAAILAGWLPVIAVVDSIRRRDWRSGALCGVALTVAALILFSGLLRFHRMMQEYRRFGTVYHTLRYIHRAVWHFYENTGHAPQSVDELIEAGLLEGDRAFLRTYVLAPLDERFFDEGLWEEVQFELLCVYRPAGYEDGSGEWLFARTSGHATGMPSADLQDWLQNQRDAIKWLDDSFPLSELEQIAEGDEGRRARMAWAILKYRRKEPERGTQGQGGG